MQTININREIKNSAFKAIYNSISTVVIPRGGNLFRNPFQSKPNLPPTSYKLNYSERDDLCVLERNQNVGK